MTRKILTGDTEITMQPAREFVDKVNSQIAFPAINWRLKQTISNQKK